MEYQQPSKFRANNWLEINYYDDTRGRMMRVGVLKTATR